MDRTRKGQGGFTLIELLIVVGLIGIIAAIALPNLLKAVDNGRQKKTMADLRTIGRAIEQYAVDNARYPVTNNLGILENAVVPAYLKRLPTTDAWGNTLSVTAVADDYTVCSGGKDGGACTGDGNGGTNSFNDSITFATGQFVQFPEGKQN